MRRFVCVVGSILLVFMAGRQIMSRSEPSRPAAAAGDRMVSLPSFGWPAFPSALPTLVGPEPAVEPAVQFQTRRDLASYYEQHRLGPDVVARYTAIAAALECTSQRLRASEEHQDGRRQAAAKELLERCGKLAQLPATQLVDDLHEASKASKSDSLGARLVRQLQMPDTVEGGVKHQLIADVVRSGDSYLLQLAEPMLYEYWNRLRGTSDQAGALGNNDPVVAGFRLALCDSGLPCGSESFDVLRACVQGVCEDNAGELIRRRLGDAQLPHADVWRQRFLAAIRNRDPAGLGIQ